MYYTVASPGWRPGHPLNPVGALLFRTRAEAESFAPGGPSVAVAVRFDQHWRVVRPLGSAARTAGGPWSAPALDNALGGLTIFGPIPAGLVRPSAEAPVDGPARAFEEAPGQAGPGFGGWDSLTMALMA